LAAAKTKLAAAKAEKPQQAPATLKAEFAAILARRLEKTSVFDLRLDPPELGRVEGKLVVNDDGKSVLSLTFDNQNAFDLFSRDEQALRLALQHAGLSFGAGDFKLSYRAPAEAAGDAFGGLSAAAPAAISYEPAFHAEWSAGALDIRI
jgi:flagellar hook-length control protein FliK